MHSSALLPQFCRPSDAAPPPLRAFAYVGPFRILGDIAQSCHDGLEHRGIRFGELEVAHEIITVLAPVPIGGVIETAVDAGNARRGRQRMPFRHDVPLRAILWEEK